jgi:predicted dienelactone hydrolase
VELFDEQMGLAFPMLVMYPSRSTERSETLGPYEMDVALNSAPAAEQSPLIVISHGNGGSHLAHRTLAAHLARHGFVVAMPEHPRNNRNNNELAGTAENLANRPRHLRLAIDWALASAQFGSRLRSDAVVVLGHSLGGYTALALAGGLPTAFGHETPDNQPRQVFVEADGRVKALVLLAPATAWFMAPGALRGVQVPILLWTAEQDSWTPAFHGDLVKAGVAAKDQVQHRVAKGGGHFAFLSPFPEALRSAAFPPSQDPPSFDRALFQEELNTGVLEFLRRL